LIGLRASSCLERSTVDGRPTTENPESIRG
jgi:hypothetical protein